MILAACLVLLFGLLVMGVPVAYCFAAVGLAAALLLGINLNFVCSVLYQAVDSFTLMAVFFFLYAGDLMGRGGLAGALVEFFYLPMRRIRGGLGLVIPVASAFFGALSGSATATTAAIGGLMIPNMERFGYERRYSAALAAVSGWLGALIPPSITLVLYALVANQSVGALFLSTVIPGILMTIFLMLINIWVSPKYITRRGGQPDPADGMGGHPSGRGAGDRGKVLPFFQEFRLASYRAIPAFFAPVIILGGIYGGVFTPTEAAAVAALYAAFAGRFIYRRLKVREIKESTISTTVLTASVLIIVSCVAILTRVLVMKGIPQQIAALSMALTDNKYIILLIVNLVILVAGMFLEAVTLTVVITPLFIPTLEAYGVNLVHFGSFMCIAIGIGSITPPMAIAFFVASRVGNVPVRELIRPSLPFLFFGCLPVLALATYFPELALWLPRIIMGN